MQDLNLMGVTILKILIDDNNCGFNEDGNWDNCVSR